MNEKLKAYRAAILHSLADPSEAGIEQSYQYFADGVLLVEDGRVVNRCATTRARHPLRPGGRACR